IPQTRPASSSSATRAEQAGRASCGRRAGSVTSFWAVCLARYLPSPRSPMRAHLAALVIPGFLVGLLFVTAAAPPAPVPPYKRYLRGADAKRAAELGRLIDAHGREGKIREAAPVARDLAALRARAQGADHWQAVDARVLAQTLARLGGLPAEQQADFSRQEELIGRARQL